MKDIVSEILVKLLFQWNCYVVLANWHYMHHLPVIVRERESIFYRNRKKTYLTNGFQELVDLQKRLINILS